MNHHYHRNAGSQQRLLSFWSLSFETSKKYEKEFSPFYVIVKHAPRRSNDHPLQKPRPIRDQKSSRNFGTNTSKILLYFTFPSIMNLRNQVAWWWMFDLFTFYRGRLSSLSLDWNCIKIREKWSYHSATTTPHHNNHQVNQRVKVLRVAISREVLETLYL